MTRRKQVNKGKIFGAFASMILFVIVIANADKLSPSEEQGYINPAFIGEGNAIPTINMDALSISIDDTEEGTVIQYIVQPEDTFESIAVEFGTTISNLKKINKIQSLPVGQKIIVTNEEDGIIYTVREVQNIKVFVQKYNLELSDLMTLNYILDDSEMLQEGQELFINISPEKANAIPGFIDKAQPNLNPQPVVRKKPKTSTS